MRQEISVRLKKYVQARHSWKGALVRFVLKYSFYSILSIECMFIYLSVLMAYEFSVVK